MANWRNIMTLDWQVVLIAVAAVFLRIVAMRPDPDVVQVGEEVSPGRSISRI
jgi:hypothetical protein